MHFESPHSPTDRGNPQTATRQLPTFCLNDLLVGAPERAFEGLTEWVSLLLNIPVVLLTLVLDGQLFIKSLQGLLTPWAPNAGYCSRLPQGSLGVRRHWVSVDDHIAAYVYKILRKSNNSAAR